MMTWAHIGWLFAVAVTLHNAEEAMWLPGWSRAHGSWPKWLDVRDFRWIALVITVLAYGCVWWANSNSVFGCYLLSGYALAMLVNVLIPHVGASVLFRSYSPGTGTALLLNLPVSLLLLRTALREHRIELRVFAWAGPMCVLGLVAVIGLLLVVGVGLRFEGRRW